MNPHIVHTDVFKMAALSADGLNYHTLAALEDASSRSMSTLENLHSSHA